MSIYDTTGCQPTFADIIAPITVEEFMRDYYDKKPLHIPGAADKFEGLMDWDILNRLLNQNAIWSSKSLMLVADRNIVPEKQYCQEAEDRSGNTVMRPVAEKVMAFLNGGASLVANDIDTLTPELRATAYALETMFDGRTQVNLYCSWRQRQAFNSHFDSHDVYALHVTGEKVWRIYSTRAPHPIRHARHWNAAYPDSEHEKMRGPLLMEITMRPGDMLYLPRGWYHDALAASGGTVHMAFSVTGVIGFDILGALSDFAVDDEEFRRNLPLLSEGPEKLAAALKVLGERLQGMTNMPEFVEAIRHHQSTFRYPRGGFQLPIDLKEKRFALARPGLKVVKQGPNTLLVGPQGGAPIPPGREKAVAWIVGQKAFDRGDYLEAHGELTVAELDRVLLDMMNMGILVEKPAA